MKMKKRARSQRFDIGDIFAVPLRSNLFAFGRVTPQYEFLEFFDVTCHHLLTAEELRQAEVIRLPYMVDTEALRTWQWEVIGHIPFAPGEFHIQPFRIGDGIASSTDINDEGFIDVTSEIRAAKSPELDRTPYCQVYPTNLVVEELISRLTKDSI